MNKKILLILALLGVLGLAASPMLVETIDWWATGPGSARLSNAGSELHGMVGQGIAGQVSVGGSELCAGYLCLPSGLPIHIRLPLILK